MLFKENRFCLNVALVAFIIVSYSLMFCWCGRWVTRWWQRRRSPSAAVVFQSAWDWTLYGSFVVLESSVRWNVKMNTAPPTAFIVTLVNTDVTRCRRLLNKCGLGQTYKLYRRHSCNNVRSSYFAVRVINVWNSLSADSVDFSSFVALKRTVQQIDFTSFLSCS